MSSQGLFPAATSGCVPSCFVVQNLWRCIWMRNIVRKPNELLRISTLIAPRWKKKTRNHPPFKSGWKWFGVVSMDELIAFWHEFVHGFLVDVVQDCRDFSLKCPIFCRSVIKVQLACRFVPLAQLARLKWVMLWFYSTPAIYCSNSTLSFQGFEQIHQNVCHVDV